MPLLTTYTFYTFKKWIQSIVIRTTLTKPMPKIIITRACGKCNKNINRLFSFQKYDFKLYNSYNRRPIRGHQKTSSRTGEFL